MANDTNRFWSVASLLIVTAALVLSSVGPPGTAYAERKMSLTEKKKLEIRREEESSLKKQDARYQKQAKSLVQQYRQAASRVAREGGDPQPLLDAAAYFENQPK